MKNLIFLLTLLLSFEAFSQTGEKNFIDQNYIEVVGKAESEIIPNLIYLKIFLNEKEIKGKLSFQEVEKNMIAKLEEFGIDISKDFFIKDFVSNFQTYWILKSDIILLKEYQVIAHDAKTAGKVFTELEKIGISNISIEKLDHSEIEKYRMEVKQKAIVNALEKAKALTSMINQEIGKAIHIQESIDNTVYNSLQGRTAGIMIRGNSSIYGSRAQEPDIEFEKIKLDYSVQVRFELK